MNKNFFIAAAILGLGIAGFIGLNQTPSGGQAPPATAGSSASSAPAEGGNRPEGERSGSPPAAEPGENNADQQPAAEGSRSSDETRVARESGQGQRRGPGMFGRIAQQSATSVEAMRAEQGQHSAVLTVYGVVAAQTSTTLLASSAATVAAINVSEGEQVIADQLLLTLTSTDATEQLIQRQADLTELDARLRSEALSHETNLAAVEIEQQLVQIAKNSVDRFDSLSAQQLSSNTDYEASLRTYQSQLLSLQSRELAVAQYALTEQQLLAQRTQLLSQIRQLQETVSDLEVSAPFAGSIAQLAVSQGQALNANDLLAELYDPDSLALYVRVPVRYRLDQTDLSQILAVDSAGRAWQVSAIRTLNESGAQRLTLLPADTQMNELPGTHLAVTLYYPLLQPSIDVPITAVYDQQRIYTFERETSSVAAVDIQVLGRSESGYLISAEGLDPRAPIITTRLKNPLTGMKVSLVRPERGERP